MSKVRHYFAVIVFVVAWVVVQLLFSTAKLFADDTKPVSPSIASGEVVSDKGEPVVGAQVSVVGAGNEVLLAGQRINSPWSTLLATTATDKSGRFEIPRSAISPQFFAFHNPKEPSFPRLTVVIQSAGWTPVWRRVGDKPAVGRIALSTSPSIEGRLLNEQGHPVAGAIVRAASFESQEEDQSESAGELDLVGLSIAPSARSDSQGKFVLPQMPRKTNVHLLVGTNPFAACRLLVNTAHEPLPATPQKISALPEETPPYARVFTARLPAHTEMRGRLTFADTGRPAPRSKVLLFVTDARSNKSTTIPVVTDGLGEFRVADLYGSECGLIATPPEGLDYGGVRRMDVRLNKPVTRLDLKFTRGHSITGEVVDQNTRRGVPEVSLAVDWKDVPSAAGESPEEWFVAGVETNAQGKFTITVPPVDGQIRVCAAPAPYEVPEEMKSGPQGELRQQSPRYCCPYSTSAIDPLRPIRFEIGLGVLVRGRVMTSDGKPIEKAHVFNEGSRRGGAAVTFTNGTSFSPESPLRAVGSLIHGAILQLN